MRGFVGGMEKDVGTPRLPPHEPVRSIGSPGMAPTTSGGLSYGPAEVHTIASAGAHAAQVADEMGRAMQTSHGDSGDGCTVPISS
ncbi:hypothetical protein SSAG_02696 [Streptomyces sp. Mg1]|nr:hypothetical protein SSAG_02696 [Streptomyces sp. Mg1]